MTRRETLKSGTKIKTAWDLSTLEGGKVEAHGTLEGLTQEYLDKRKSNTEGTIVKYCRNRGYYLVNHDDVKTAYKPSEFSVL